ncbi:hypothetical protein [Rhodobacter ferrooxidans]|uniref:Lipoprotein n=1 Tax=Rhodobacter ferrooxidans TaxID=371731 RepID=C8S3H6_9RHOB|nr:hypothetical protein [Rhodobacter sp. SW2]EEW24424.1 conserved hypothetical protein [Rhodobacter sp. SW2]
MKHILPFALLLGLAACVGTGPSRPAEVRLSASTLTVMMADGRRCDAPWAAGAGRMQDCGLDWQVVVDKPNPLRRAFVDLSQALGLAVTPMARISLTDATGQTYGFTSPPPRPVKDD